MGIEKRDKLICETWRRSFEGTAITERMFRSEIDWYKDQMLFDQVAYLDAERRGRGFRLSSDQRKQMYDAIAQYQKRLQ